MSIARVLLLFAFLVFSAFAFKLLYWLLNSPNDLYVVGAGFVLVMYLWLAIKSRCFTQNPF